MIERIILRMPATMTVADILAALKADPELKADIKTAIGYDE